MLRVKSMMKTTQILLLLAAVVCNALYTEKSPVVSLTDGNFAQRLEKGGYWIVEFYAPWCGHCQQLQPEYEKTARGLESVITVAAIDCDRHKSTAGQYGIQGFPTIKLFYTSSHGTLVNVDYKGERTASGLISWAMDQTKKVVMKKAASKEEKKQKSKKKGSGGGGGSTSGFYGASSDVINVGSGDFDDLVRDSDDIWMMEFYAPWCGHCKNLKGDWERTASDLKGKVKVGAVDCTAHESLCSEFSVQGFPTLKFFGTNKHSPEDYGGGRDAAAIVAFALEKWSTAAPPPEVKELTESYIFDKYCAGDEDEGAIAQQLCIILFLPHILDSQASGRNEYIDMLKKISLHYKVQAFGYLWAEGGKQTKVEATFRIGGFGYPAAVLYSPRKKAYSVLKLGVDYKHFVEFIDGIRHGLEKVSPIDGDLGQIVTTVPWDGKDQEEVMENEFSLDEIMNEEL